MSQSSFIAAVLLGMFVVYLCDKDRLQVYGQALWGAAPSASGSSSSSSSGSSDLISTAKSAAEIASFVGL